MFNDLLKFVLWQQLTAAANTRLLPYRTPLMMINDFGSRHI
jgi:hypothetical protein